MSRIMIPEAEYKQRIKKAAELAEKNGAGCISGQLQ